MFGGKIKYSGAQNFALMTQFPDALLNGQGNMDGINAWEFIKGEFPAPTEEKEFYALFGSNLERALVTAILASDNLKGGTEKTIFKAFVSNRLQETSGGGDAGSASRPGAMFDPRNLEERWSSNLPDTTEAADQVKAAAELMVNPKVVDSSFQYKKNYGLSEREGGNYAKKFGANIAEVLQLKGGEKSILEEGESLNKGKILVGGHSHWWKHYLEHWMATSKCKEDDQFPRTCWQFTEGTIANGSPVKITKLQERELEAAGLTTKAVKGYAPTCESECICLVTKKTESRKYCLDVGKTGPSVFEKLEAPAEETKPPPKALLQILKKNPK